MPIHHQITAIGHLGGDATVNNYQGNQVINFNLAVTDDIKKQDGTWEQRTVWYHCSYWSDRNAEPLKKGTLVIVEGKPQVEMWEKDGVKKAQGKIIVESMRILSKADGNRPNVQQQAPIQAVQQTPTPEYYQQQQQQPTQSSQVDDLPF